MEEPRKGLQGEQLELAKSLVSEVRERLQQVTAGDQRFLFSLRRYIRIRLEHDERGRPGDRKKVKYAKAISQRGLCAICGETVPKEAELDRLDPEQGYTEGN
ncbi:MAG TPA: hypothetical protein VFA90_08650 [Terriglobales bacterium]|nr:hypothetical protein [Terriglobales bacterium]